MFLTLLGVATLTLNALLPQDPGAEARFPASTALAEEVNPDALAELDSLIQSFVDEGDIVGAELLVIKNGKSILHEAYGLSDNVTETPMQKDSLFCVRSMTKPVAGTAILMLLDEKKLHLGDHVAEYLPSFDTDALRDITVEQLLTHTGGLTMSLLMDRSLDEFEDITEVAALASESALEFEPGTGFNYSDQGTDTLTALIEVVTGAPAEEFVRMRILGPLGMEESTCVLGEDHPLRARSIAKHAGSRGAWTRYWSPEDPPIFHFFLGSQSLYSTTTDYARFMDFWLRKGRIGKERLLGNRYVRKTLKPGPHPMDGPTGFPEVECQYGFLMEVWLGTDDEGEKEVVAFGHNGSDGTHAWVFPEQKAMVMYFTQSRYTPTGLRVEDVLSRLFLGAEFDPNLAAPPFDDYLGYYWEGEGDTYRAIVRDGDDLAMEILGKAVVPLTYAGGDSWKFRPNPGVVVEFDRAPSGMITGYHIGDHQEFRFEPSAELPDIEELTAGVSETHRIDLLETLGPIRMESKLTIDKLGIEGDVSTLLQWPDRFRMDTTSSEQFERVAYDGTDVRYTSPQHPLAKLDADRTETVRLESHLARLGDWKRWFPGAQVIQKLERGSHELILVRMGDTTAPRTHLYVDSETFRVMACKTMTYAEGLGRIGMKMQFGDFRDVSGMLLPHKASVEYANPMIGEVVTTVTGVELGVEVPEGTFELAD